VAFDESTAQLHDDPDAGTFGKWMLANAKGASARTRKEAAEGIVAAFKGNALPEDAVREILRSSHKVLPPAARRGLRKAWYKAQAASKDQKIDEGDFWADNAAKIMGEKFTGRGSWRASARKWLKQATAEAVRVAGVRADDPTLKAVERLLQERA